VVCGHRTEQSFTAYVRQSQHSSRRVMNDTLSVESDIYGRLWQWVGSTKITLR